MRAPAACRFPGQRGVASGPPAGVGPRPGAAKDPEELWLRRRGRRRRSGRKSGRCRLAGVAKKAKVPREVQGPGKAAEKKGNLLLLLLLLPPPAPGVQAPPPGGALLPLPKSAAPISWCCRSSMEPAESQRRADLLSMAAGYGNLETVRRLLDAGVDPNAVNSCGRTPIQVMKMMCPSVAELLLQRGADPNRPELRTGSFPVHNVAQEGCPDTLQVLCQGGAHLDAKDHWGHLPLDMSMP